MKTCGIGWALHHTARRFSLLRRGPRELRKSNSEQVLAAVKVELVLLRRRLIACRNRLYRETGIYPDDLGTEWQSTGSAWLRGESVSFRFARRFPNPARQMSSSCGGSLREAAVGQYGPFSPANVASVLTQSAERISKVEISGSPNLGDFESCLLRGFLSIK
jgi:hypothetical protein